MKKITLIFVLLLLPLAAHSQGLESVYSDLSAKSCKTVQTDKETGDTTQLCPGIAGYKLKVYDSDLRQSIGVMDPSGKEQHLDYYHAISANFSSLGPKAEWRVDKKDGKLVPRALIVRVNASENPDKPDQKTSYLAVAKLGPETCVTAKIPPSKDMNEAAQQSADQAANKPCLK